jgi:hypothetical protein
VPELWAGIDAGKSHHHCVVLDADGKRRLSRRVANDETALLELTADVAELAGDDATTGRSISTAEAQRCCWRCWSTKISACSTFPAAPSTTRQPATAETARPTPRTPRSSPTRPACAATCNR